MEEWQIHKRDDKRNLVATGHKINLADYQIKDKFTLVCDESLIGGV